MEPREFNKVMRKIRKERFLSLETLDSILEEDKTYSWSLERLNRDLDAFEIEFPEDEGGNGAAIAPSYSSGHDLYFQYIKEIRNKPRLNRDGESRISKRMEFFKKRFTRAVQKTHLPAPKAEELFQTTRCIGRPGTIDIGPVCERLGKCPRGKKDMIHEHCRAYNKCRAIFVEKNLFLVVNLCQPYKTYGIPLMDLIQEGNTSLIRAVEKFDWRKNVRFQTYASFWIRQAVERLIGANKGIVRIPNYIQQKMRRFKREGKLASQGETISARDLSEAFDVSSQVAGHLLETERRHVSLDSAPSNHDEYDLTDVVAEEPLEIATNEEVEALKQKLEEALQLLDKQERTIIKHRFGLEGVEQKTLDEMGEMLGVSRERIRQLQIRALQKLKKPKFLEGLQGYL